jgi:predicted acetyltransferase
MTDDTIELRQPATDTESLRAYVAPIAVAFGEPVDDGEFDADIQLFEPDRAIGAMSGGAWVGGGSAYSYRLTVPGRREVGAAGITGVGVRPDHRRQGILTRIMRWLLGQAAERGEPVAILHASEGAIYPHFGFGLATLQGTFDIERSQFWFGRPAEPLGRVRLVDLDEAMGIIPDLYDRVRLDSPGQVTRSAAKWRAQMLANGGALRAKAGTKSLAVLEVDGAPRGYAIYRTKSDWTDRGPANEVIVMEVLGLDPAAERTLWEWIAGIDLLARIKGWRTPVPHPLFLGLHDLRRMALVVGDGLWLRLVDLPGAMAGRSYMGSGAVNLEVTDTFLPANAGRWRLEVTGGSATVTPTTDGPDLTLDTADLATVYLCGFTFADLARAGRVGECRPDAIADADRLFTTNTVAWCSTPF